MFMAIVKLRLAALCSSMRRALEANSSRRMPYSPRDEWKRAAPWDDRKASYCDRGSDEER